MLAGIFFQRYLIFTLNKQMDKRTKFDTVDNQVVFFFISTLAVVSHRYETVPVGGSPTCCIKFKKPFNCTA